MTTMAKNITCCSVCGSSLEYSEIMSTNTFGSSDLDLRPAPMMRWTINTWVQRCPECGYAAKRIMEPCPVPVEFLSSERYKTCGGIEFKGELAKAFFQQSMIAHECNNSGEEFSALQHAAWACDDEEDTENAIKVRLLALDPLSSCLKEEHKDDMYILHADIMRRAGLFDRVVETYENTVLENEFLTRILQFEVKKARENDYATYTVSDVTQED